MSKENGIHRFASASVDSDIHRFVSALFDRSDMVLIRPIETWTENGRKRSEVDRDGIEYLQVQYLLQRFDKICQRSESKKTNLFFGVCPRVDRKQYDLAWQIRTVRALWADIDHIETAAALDRVKDAGIPDPSIVVRSGNGVHLYWLLDHRYIIDDAPPPPPVQKEWETKPNGKKKPRDFVRIENQKLYLDSCPDLKKLSPKAEQLQSILEGIAQRIGGDHTHDLARLLRLPGTLNRKDARNGKEPVPSRLVSCDPNIKYGIDVFEPFRAAKQPDAAAIPLPKHRKITPRLHNTLAEKIAECQLDTRDRSRSEFDLLCFAIRKGAPPEEIWLHVQHFGKFKERGREYFDLTWKNAEGEVRSDIIKKAANNAQKRNAAEHVESQRPIVEVDQELHTVDNTLSQVTSLLHNSGNCYQREDQLVVMRGSGLQTITQQNELIGLFSEHAECRLVRQPVNPDNPPRRTFEPLPSRYAAAWLNNSVQLKTLRRITMFTETPVYTADWSLAQAGYNEASGILNVGPGVTPQAGTNYLDTLLSEFCWKSPCDRTNYIGMLLTIVTMPHFIGSHPAILLNGNQPGLGKSVLAQIIAILRCGHQTETITYNPRDDEFEKRLGATVKRGATTVIVDNAKGGKIESACLERSITDHVLSFRLLGQSSEIRSENSHIFAITANCSDVSRDLITRSVLCQLEWEGDPARRSFQLPDPESYAVRHRTEILGELLGMVERWRSSGSPRSDAKSRFNKAGWASIIGGILEANNEPDFLVNAESAAADLDETSRDFAELVAILVERSTLSEFGWSANELVSQAREAGLLRDQLSHGTLRSQAIRLGFVASRFLGESFRVGGQTFCFAKVNGRNGSLYCVRNVAECPAAKIG